MRDVYSYYMEYNDYGDKLHILAEFFKVICYYILYQYMISDIYMRSLSLGIAEIDVELKDKLLEDIGIDVVGAKARDNSQKCITFFSVIFKEELLSFDETLWYKKLVNLRNDCESKLQEFGVDVEYKSLRTNITVSLPFLEKPYKNEVNFKLFSMLNLWEEERYLTDKGYVKNITKFINVPKYYFITADAYKVFMENNYFWLDGFKGCIPCIIVRSTMELFLIHTYILTVHTLLYITSSGRIYSGSEYVKKLTDSFVLAIKDTETRLDIVFDSSKVLVDFNMELANSKLNVYNVWLSMDREVV